MTIADFRIIQNTKIIDMYTHAPYINTNTLSIQKPSNTSQRAKDITNKEQEIKEA
jgi:hypothetical protein